MIEILNAREIDGVRTAARATAATLAAVAGQLRAGMTTLEVDALVHRDTLTRGATPATLNYKGYKHSCCVSRNQVVCHGIPNEREKLRNGDIVNVDCSSIVKGWFGDTSATFAIGEISPAARHVMTVARMALEAGIAVVRDGARLGDIGAAIEQLVVAQGCTVVRDFGGHGIGRRFHMDPHVNHFGTRGTGVRLKAGMVFTIEPMVNLGSAAVRILDDGWTVVTEDGSLSAQFEHTVLVTRDGCEVLTRIPAEVQLSAT